MAYTKAELDKQYPYCQARPGKWCRAYSKYTTGAILSKPHKPRKA